MAKTEHEIKIRNDQVEWEPRPTLSSADYASLEVWEEPLVELRLPKLFNLRSDPFERADHDGIGYKTWRIEKLYALGPAQTYVARWLQSFKEFPPRQKPGTFNLSSVMEKLSATAQ